MEKKCKLFLFFVTALFIVAFFNHPREAYAAGNSLGEATPVEFGQTYYGYIDSSNKQDWYKIELPSSGYYTIKTHGEIEGVNYCLYKADGSGYYWHDVVFWNSTSHISNETYGQYLNSGTYYFLVKLCSPYTGNYDVTVTFKSSEESFHETAGGSNETRQTASPIELGNTYKGVMTNNEKYDFYKFVLPEDAMIDLNLTFELPGIRYEFYNGDGEFLSRDSFYWDDTTMIGNRLIEKEFKKGTYYLVISAYSGLGKYSFSLSLKSAANGIAINADSFPDEAFRDYVLERIDTNKDRVLSETEIETVKQIVVGPGGISNLTGIEYFTSLKELYCGRNDLDGLDLKANVNLEKLDCSYNNLTGLDLNANILLSELDCSHNRLSALDLYPNTSLTKIDCSDNALGILNISSNTLLRELYCSNNYLTTLDLQANTLLTTLDCSYNNLTALKLNDNQNLTYLDCYENNITQLDISNNRFLLNVYQNGNCSRSDLESVLMYMYNDGVFRGSLTIDSNVTVITSVLPEDGWIEEDGHIYFYEDGKPVVGWFEIYNKTYYADQNGVIQRGWKDIYGNRYYFAPDGEMKTGWQKISGNWYFLGIDGKMKTGWLKSSGKWYYLGSNGIMKTGWHIISGRSFYFGTGGYMKTGWLKLSGKWYYFGTNGNMRTGWKKISGKWYYFKSNGVMAAGEYCDGYWLNKNGTWTYKPRATWRRNNKGRWFGDTKGWYAKNTWLIIDDGLYYFDQNGYLNTY